MKTYEKEFIEECVKAQEDLQRGIIEPLECSTRKLDALGHLIYLQAAARYKGETNDEQTK